MARKIFALASVSALAGIITATAAGCSDDKTDPPGGDPTQDAAPDVKKPNKPDATDDDAGQPESCVSKTDVDTSGVVYKKARVQPSSCTEAESKALSKYVKDNNGQAKVDEWKAVVSPKCAACVFSDGKDSWSPINVNGNTIDTNFGGCMEVESGSTACGDAYQKYTECPAVACKDCADETEYAACRKTDNAIYKGVCKAAVQKVQADCGDKLQTYLDACFNDKIYYLFEAAVNSLCVAAAKDGGGD